MAAQISTEQGNPAPDRRGFSETAILVSAISWSTVPAIIHLSARDTNPFIFNFVAYGGLSVLMVGFLVFSKQRLLNEPLATLRNGTDAEETPRLRSLDCHLRYLKRVENRTSAGRSLAAIHKPNKTWQWFSIPLFYMTISSFQVAFLTWSTHLVETAISTTVYETWPAFMIYGLARLHRTDEIYRTSPNKEARDSRLISIEQRVLILIGVLGLFFILGSQTKEFQNIDDLFLSPQAIAGIALALVAAILAAFNVVGSMAYGRALYYQFVPQVVRDPEDRILPIDKRGAEDKRLLLWLTVFGLTIGRLLSLPIVLIIGLFSAQATLNLISVESIIGALALGFVNTVVILFLRLGNLNSDTVAVNSLFFLTPVVGLGLLAIIGIDLPRFDLFVIGAALILAINVLIQMKPDEERDQTKFGIASRQGTRFGFTAFILSSWVFGTMLYLRDELFQATWLNWNEDYWGLLGLSATVFALILGFRIARISARIGTEDEKLMVFFRDCELAAGKTLVDKRVISAILRLDTANSSELRDVYNEVRTYLVEGAKKAETSVEREQLNALEKELDALAHSKQLGRDIVELISLSAFAAITIGLGILARPGHLMDVGSSWNGFLAEGFMLIFVSTIGFLCVNLFDIRREREAPLMVPIHEFDNDYRLFYRNPRKVTARYTFAVLLSAIMIATFIALLYSKWL